MDCPIKGNIRVYFNPGIDRLLTCFVEFDIIKESAIKGWFKNVLLLLIALYTTLDIFSNPAIIDFVRKSKTDNAF